MRALVVDPSLIDSGSGRRGRGRRRRVQQGSSLPVEVRDVRTPVPPGPGWVLIRPALAGICGTDLALVHLDSMPNVLTAYGGARALLPGHEVVGVVERAASTRWAHEGDRVLVEPTLRCAHKGLAECRRCRAGDTHLCENRDRAGALCSGSAIGSGRRSGGGGGGGFRAAEGPL